MRCWRLVVLAAALSLLPWVLGGAVPDTATETDLFSSDSVPHIEIEVTDEGMEKLREHTGRRADTPYREDVLATVRESGRTYRAAFVASTRIPVSRWALTGRSRDSGFTGCRRSA